MNILYFLEPSIEFGNPLFRYNSLKNSILPQVKSLLEFNNIATLVSEPIANKAVEDNIHEQLGHLCVVDPFLWMNGEEYNKRALRLLKGEISAQELKMLKKILLEALPPNFEPDLIICWESPAPFLEKIFKNSQIINQIPGFFSRAPYPFFISMNRGLLDKYVPALSQRNYTSEEYKSLSEYREYERHFLNTTFPLHKITDSLRKKYKKLILIPLQIDNYFMVDTTLGKKNQFELLYDILNNIPKDYALIVTNYISKDIQSGVLSSEGAAYLKRIFPNFIYDIRFNGLYCASQFLVPIVDGIITISSSVGLQAAFWEKPLFVLGKNHISYFSTADNITSFINQLGERINRDNKILDEILFQNIPVSIISDGHKLYEFIENIITGNYNKSIWLKNLPLGQWLTQNRRDIELLKAIKFSESNFYTITPTHCTELSQQIKKHDIISFDIFDTLLVRPFIHPTDLFTYIADKVKLLLKDPSIDFKKIRVESEREAMQKAKSRFEGETTIDEIYSILGEKLGIATDTAERIKQIEVNTEYSLLYRRETGYNAFLEAKNYGKRIIITSDMYLPASFLTEVLSKNGYVGYENIFVSSTYKMKKSTGKLYKFIINKLNVAPQKILHIGDNLEADIIRAKEVGLHAFHLPKAFQQFKENKNGMYAQVWARDESRHSESWKLMLGIIGNRLHDNPYLPHRRGTIFDGVAERLGYAGFGPLLLGFSKWLCEQSCKRKVDRLYFLSRDGKIMKEAYDKVSQLYPNSPASFYLYCSRRAVNLAKVKSIQDIIDLLQVEFAHRVSLSHLLHYRFGINPTDIPESILSKHNYTLDTRLTAEHLPALKKLFTDISSLILSVADKERKEYLEYLNSIGIYDSGNVAIVDIGYAGTMQESLYNLNEKNKKISGYYLITFRKALERLSANDLDSYGFLGNFIDRHDTFNPFCKHVPLYETLFSSLDTSFIHIVRNFNGVPQKIFMPPSAKETRRQEVVQDIHKGGLDFIDDTIRIFSKHLPTLDIEQNKSCRSLVYYFDYPHPRDAEIMNGIVFEDAYGGITEKIILPPLSRFEGNYVWKAGFDAIIKARNNKNMHAAPETFISSNITPQFDSWISLILYKIFKSTLNPKKLNKLIHKPELFFNDSKSVIIKSIGKKYIKGLKR